jgi:hypothetical protein
MITSNCLLGIADLMNDNDLAVNQEFLYGLLEETGIKKLV